MARSCKAQREGWASGEQGVYMGIQYLLGLWVGQSFPTPITPVGPGDSNTSSPSWIRHILGALSSQNFMALGS